MEKKHIDIVIPTFNEEENVEALYLTLKEIAERLGRYLFTFTFIDNKSTDSTRTVIEHLAERDKRVRAIYNARNFGHIRSPFYGLSGSDGDCAILMAADFQDPPEMIEQFIQKWEQGYKVIYAVKKKSRENKLMYLLRSIYYCMMKWISETEQIEHFTGYGLYDKAFLRVLKDIDDPYPYMRGLVSELGFDSFGIEFVQPKRKRGESKNNFYTLYDMAALGITSYTKKLMRLAIFLSISLGILSFLGLAAAAAFDIAGAGVDAAIYAVLGLSLFLSVILFFIGLLSEYVMLINQRTLHRPLVIVEKRINFDQTQNPQDNNE